MNDGDRANEVRVELYRTFVEESRAATAREIAERLDVRPEEVIDGLRWLDDRDVIALRPGTDEVWLAHPFCATPAPFKVKSKARSWDAICIWDALGILALIEEDGEVETACPDCGEALIVRIDENRIEGPSSAIVHFGVPADRWYEDIAFT